MEDDERKRRGGTKRRRGEGSRGVTVKVSVPEGASLTVRLGGGSSRGPAAGKEPRESAVEKKSRFHVGQVVRHSKFFYRGVVVNVDPVFSGTQEWYDEVARSRPPRDRPWYHVVAEESPAVRYVAERHLEADASGEPVKNPLVNEFFSGFSEGVYLPKRLLN